MAGPRRHGGRRTARVAAGSQHVEEQATMATEDEYEQALTDLEPRVAALEKVARLDIQPETRAAIEQQLAAYRRRAEVVRQARLAAQNLAADGYPELAPLPVPQNVLDDLPEQTAGAQAGSAQFTAQPEPEPVAEPESSAQEDTPS